jgi:FtsZ-interacting cell division protein ZipA
MLDSYWFIVLVSPLIKLLLVFTGANCNSKVVLPVATQTSGIAKVISNKVRKYDINSGLLAIYLLADDGCSFLGYDLLQSCTSNNLYYDQKLFIFHKYCHNSGKKIKCFSIAKASKPGFFDVDSLGGSGSKGIVCFIDIKCLGKHALEFYDDFIKTLEGLQGNLGGNLYDKYKNPVTDKLLYEWREYAKVICMRYGTTDFFKKNC